MVVNYELTQQVSKLYFYVFARVRAAGGALVYTKESLREPNPQKGLNLFPQGNPLSK